MIQSKRMPAPRGPLVSFTFDGATVTGYAGETLAAALLAAGVPAFGLTREGQPRLPLCNMGTCFDCAVTVDGQRLVRACLTDLHEGMCVARNQAS